MKKQLMILIVFGMVSFTFFSCGDQGKKEKVAKTNKENNDNSPSNAAFKENNSNSRTISCEYIALNTIDINNDTAVADYIQGVLCNAHNDVVPDGDSVMIKTKQQGIWGRIYAFRLDNLDIVRDVQPLYDKISKVYIKSPGSPFSCYKVRGNCASQSRTEFEPKPGEMVCDDVLSAPLCDTSKIIDDDKVIEFTLTVRGVSRTFRIRPVYWEFDTP